MNDIPTEAEESEYFWNQLIWLAEKGQLEMAWELYETTAATFYSDYELRKPSLLKEFNLKLWGEYKNFLKSDYWSDKKNQKYKVCKENGKYICSKVGCGVRKNLQLHHKNYSMPWGLEKLETLIYLCEPCHKREHGLEEKNNWFGI